MMFGPWSTLPSSEEPKETQVEEIWERCRACGGSGILITENGLYGEWSYHKCKLDDCKNGRRLVDVVIKE